MSRLSAWDFKNDHTQMDDNLYNGFVSGESVVIVAGPRQLSSTVDADTISNLRPIGVVESATVAQNKQIQQIFEIGSRKSFLIPGRTQVNVGLSRILFSGDSLLSALHEYNENNFTDATGNSGGLDNVHKLEDSPGYKTRDQNNDGTDASGQKYFLNLASSFFNHPMGLGFLFNDSDNQQMAFVYLQDCMVRSHQMSIGANQTILMENVNIMADSVLPFDVATSQLTTG